MTTRKALAVWNGTLKEGNGTMSLGSGAYEGAYTWASRFADEAGTNPEELIGAAHAGCFTMSLSGQLTRAGYTPAKIQTEATVHLERDDKGPLITLIELSTTAEVPGIDDATFMTLAENAKNGCPISRALAGTRISLIAQLVA